MTTRDYLNKNIKNERLKAVLQARWGNYGVSPAQSAFAIHALIEHHYYPGAVFPDGGAEKISSLIENTIELSGGKILISREVTEIILDKNKAIGVRVKNLSDPDQTINEYYAPCIISSAGADTTYLKLLPQSLNLNIQNELKNYPSNFSGINIYLGLKDSPEKLGIKGENYWIFDGYDDDLFEKKHLADNKLESAFCFISFPSLKSNKPGGHTADIVTILPKDLFEIWKNEKWKKRKNNYYALKDQIAESVIKLVDKYIPGFSALIAYKETATPLTYEHFTNRKNGLFYGIPAFPERFRIKRLEVKTPIKNLFLTGTDILSNGIMASLFSALGTVSYLNGLIGIVKIVSKAINFNLKRLKQKTIKTDEFEFTETEDKATAVLIKKENTASHLVELTFQFSRDLSFIPGQHIKLLVMENEWRSYSIAKTDKNKLTLIIDLRPEGPGAKFAQNIQIGEKSLFRMPITDLVYHDSSRSLMFIATGTGLIPFLHMMDELKKAGVKKKITLLFGCMKESEDITENYLKNYKDYFDIEIQVCVENPTEINGYYKGRVTDYLTEKKYNPNSYDFYICGHPNMTDSTVKLLRSMGANSIYY